MLSLDSLHELLDVLGRIVVLLGLIELLGLVEFGLELLRVLARDQELGVDALSVETHTRPRRVHLLEEASTRRSDGQGGRRVGQLVGAALLGKNGGELEVACADGGGHLILERKVRGADVERLLELDAELGSRQSSSVTQAPVDGTGAVRLLSGVWSGPKGVAGAEPQGVSGCIVSAQFRQRQSSLLPRGQSLTDVVHRLETKSVLSSCSIRIWIAGSRSAAIVEEAAAGCDELLIPADPADVIYMLTPRLSCTSIHAFSTSPTTSDRSVTAGLVRVMRR